MNHKQNEITKRAENEAVSTAQEIEYRIKQGMYPDWQQRKRIALELEDTILNLTGLLEELSKERKSILDALKYLDSDSHRVKEVLNTLQDQKNSYTTGNFLRKTIIVDDPHTETTEEHKQKCLAWYEELLGERKK